MQETIKLLFGIVFLIIGYFAGDFLAKITKEELKSGQKYFKLIILISLIGIVISLFAGNDVLLFSFAFIAIVTSRSIK
mgnify:CR=1 FL=1